MIRKPAAVFFLLQMGQPIHCQDHCGGFGDDEYDFVSTFAFVLLPGDFTCYRHIHLRRNLCRKFIKVKAVE
jgi:hypothetical protein